MLNQSFSRLECVKGFSVSGFTVLQFVSGKAALFGAGLA